MEKSQRNNQRTKRNVIISALLAILLCIGIIVGATFALFTSEDKVNVSVTSGNVEITAVASDLWLYSPKAISTEDYAVSDDENVATTNDEKTSGTFVNGGKATLGIGEDEEQLLALDKMTPGDKVTFKIVLTNHSKVSTKYRTKVVVSDDTGLFAGLSINIGGITAQATSIWKNLPAAADGGTVIATYECSVELPATADNTYKNKACKIAYLVEQVQANAATTDEENAPIGASTATAAVESLNNDNKTQSDISLSSVDTVTVTKTEPAGESTTTESVSVASAFVPSGAKLADGATSLTLNIYETETNDSNFTIETVKNDASLAVKTIEVEMKGLDNAKNDSLITVSMYVGKGLEGFKLYHNSEDMNAKDSADAVVANQDYYYDSETGFLTLKTVKFSPFTYVCYAIIEVASMEDLSVESSADWARIVKPGYYKLTSSITVSKSLCVNAGGVVIDLNGNTLTIDGKEFRTNAAVVDAKFSNGTIEIKSGNLWMPSWGTTNLTFKNVNVTSKGKDVFWARSREKECNLNIIGENFNITDSRFLWACPDEGSAANPSKVNVTASGVNVKQTNYRYLEAVMLQTQYNYGEVVANFTNCTFDSSTRDKEPVVISSYETKSGNSISLKMDGCSLIAKTNTAYISSGYTASNVTLELDNCTGNGDVELTKDSLQNQN